LTQQETLEKTLELEARKHLHQAIILKILNRYPTGLTAQQIVEKELEVCHYTFLTDNRLRELLDPKEGPVWIRREKRQFGGQELWVYYPLEEEEKR
jgi:hypothetical protein